MSILEKLSTLADNNESRDLLTVIKKTNDPKELMHITILVVKLEATNEVIIRIIKHAININAIKVILYILKKREDVTLQDVLDCIKVVNHAHIVSDLYYNKCLPSDITINELCLASSIYKIYRCERFAQLRLQGYTPVVAHMINEQMF